MPKNNWVRVVAVVSRSRGTASLEFVARLPLPARIGSGAASTRTSNLSLPTKSAVLAIAATAVKEDARGRKYGANTFNGKLDGVRVLGRAADEAPSRLLAAWDFSLQMNTACILDISGSCRHGLLINAPARAMTGHAWTGDEVDFRLIPSEYGAVHFHDDDLEDAGWDVTATLVLPADLTSGIYAVRVQGDKVGDNIPIFVLPALGGQKAEIAFLAPTFTYQAYANIIPGDRDYGEAGIAGIQAVTVARDLQLQAFPAFVGSLYEKHSDGSGRCYSSFKRPIFNLRADHKNALIDGPRNFGADLYLTSWLEHIGQRYDVLTDHALDTERGLLVGYKVVITGSHPEYWSGRMLTAIEQFLSKGGKVMYLGGNGFYWVTGQDPARPYVVECRRGYSGIRTWQSEPGEVHLNSTGEQGGLWRHRGRAPNRLVGVGMASQGWDTCAPGFTKTSVGASGEYDWVFAGTEGDHFGNAGFAMDGASGDEIDRHDIALGSPVHSVVLATSQGHSHFYKLAVEEVDMITDGLDGTSDGRVRSDIVLIDWENSGKVFSVGSINWAASLAWNNFDNSVETITRNVLLQFLSSP
ncbi:N,N-dimethylformamidase beta subunit family domain-containing protein [Sinorhizobium meliloti]|uniref:N,N-dimethylformamidase beta subunit family domain-containing protein n=1 Tax=Rhizobium meliloti TaxID=382 RepID=UPI001F1C0600|nr:GldG family protein [Sinorhizobium meliloti]